MTDPSHPISSRRLQPQAQAPARDGGVQRSGPRAHLLPVRRLLRARHGRVRPHPLRPDVRGGPRRRGYPEVPRGEVRRQQVRQRSPAEQDGRPGARGLPQAGHPQRHQQARAQRLRSRRPGRRLAVREAR